MSRPKAGYLVPTEGEGIAPLPSVSSEAQIAAQDRAIAAEEKRGEALAKRYAGVGARPSTLRDVLHSLVGIRYAFVAPAGVGLIEDEQKGFRPHSLMCDQWVPGLDLLVDYVTGPKDLALKKVEQKARRIPIEKPRTAYVVLHVSGEAMVDALKRSLWERDERVKALKEKAKAA